MLLHRRSLGVRVRLVFLTLATMLPLVALAGFGIVNAVDNQRTEVRRTVIERTEALLAAVDNEINGAQSVLRVLASSPSLLSGDLEAFDKHMRAALDPSELAIVLHDDAAQQLVSTNRPFGTPLPRQTASEMLDRVVATGQPQVSDLIIGAVLRRPIVTVGVPVFREGRVFYVLAMALDPKRLSNVLQRQNQPPKWTVAIFDRKGITVARNKELERFLGVAAAPILLDHMNRDAADDWFANVTKDGEPVYSTFRRSAVTGWEVAIGVPRKAVGWAVANCSVHRIRRRRGRGCREPRSRVVAGASDPATGRRIDDLSAGIGRGLAPRRSDPRRARTRGGRRGAPHQRR